MKIRILLIFLTLVVPLMGQNTKARLTTFDGTVVAGALTNGGFLNFVGPSITAKMPTAQIALGMLPSLRFSQDKGITHNTFITPGLGLGLTVTRKWFAVQIPSYYEAKTPTSQGRWRFGLGVGIRLNTL